MDFSTKQQHPDFVDSEDQSPPGLSAKQMSEEAEPRMTYDEILARLRGYSITQRSKALEDLIRHLIDQPIEAINAEVNRPKSRFKTIVQLFIERFKRREDHSSLKCVEVQLDCLEYFLSTIPETLLEDIGPICLSLIVCSMLQRSQISDKAREILSFIKEILTADLVLPHLIVAIDNEKSGVTDVIK